MGWMTRMFSRGPQIYGAPYKDKNGAVRIRIFQLTGRSKRDNLFMSSIEDVYPNKEAAVSLLNSVKGMKVLDE